MNEERKRKEKKTLKIPCFTITVIMVIMILERENF